MLSVVALAFLAHLATSTSVTDIQGPAFQSPLLGQTVHNVTGVVTAKSSDGFYIQGTPVSDTRVSHGLSIFSTSSSVLNKVAVGDEISLSGKVNEFRSSDDPDDLFTTELESPTNIVVLSSNNRVTPLILGQDRSPPTQQISGLDTGPDGWLAIPNNTTQVESVNATLQPDLFGQDFWESLEGQLVTVKTPVAIDFENSFGEFWVHGDWPVTGKNSRGGLSLTFGPDNIPDANPEVIIVGSPLDGTNNPSVSVGQTFSDITGIVQYQFGFYYVLPLTAPTIKSTPSPNIPVTTITRSTDECTLTLGDYNVDNMAPNSTTLPVVATHIAKFLAGPDLMFVQEIQDNSGPTDDGTVSANLTMQTIADAVVKAGGPTYSFIDISPVNNEDGGEGGGNIRQVYFYREDKITLVPGSPVGGPLDATEVTTDSSGQLTLSFNPGRVDPTNSAWQDSRKPLAAVWQTTSGHRFFTVNLHLIAKTGGTTAQGNARTPINQSSGERINQVATTAAFVSTILKKDPNASIIVGGDCNEFIQTRAVISPFTEIMTEIDEVANLPIVERYTYVFDQNNEQLDHLFVSDAVKARGAQIEHVHVNNWGPSIDTRASDHDPSVAKLKVC